MGREIHRKRSRPDRALPGVAALVSLALAGCVGDRTATVAPAAVSVPAGAPRVTGVERPSADSDHEKLVAAFGGEVQAPQARRLLTEVTQRLVQATDRPDERYEVTILDAPVTNAFALPNGRLYVTRGLLALANDTSELAGVLAHEIAHVTLRHAAARTELALRSALVSKVVEDVLRDPGAGAEFKSNSRVSFASFSRAQELEADQMGVRTLARAGFDPYGAVRFLESLNRNSALRSAAGEKASTPDMLATHPGTPERIALATQAARAAGAPGIGNADRATYLAAIEGIPYGDNPADGLIRGRSFIHPRLGVAFEAPEGFSLENTGRATIGTTPDGNGRLLFDAIGAGPGQSLAEVLRSSWSDEVEARSIETTAVNGYPVALAASRGKEWSFRLAVIRAGAQTFRLILAGRSGRDVEAAFRRALGSVRSVSPEEAATLRPARIAVVTAAPGDTVERMSARTGSAERFRLLNGLSPGVRQLNAGEPYKVLGE